MKSVGISQEPSVSAPPPSQRVRSSVFSSTSSSSISSVMSSPLSGRLSFQTFTNFIPLSWGSSVNEAPTTTSSHSHSATERVSDHAVSPVNVVLSRRAGGYVSREKQLRLLKTRMELEGVVAMTSFANVQCKKCDKELVFI